MVPSIGIGKQRKGNNVRETREKIEGERRYAGNTRHQKSRTTPKKAKKRNTNR
jgi:hypothetical protein